MRHCNSAYAEDATGRRWTIRERRPTDHGFDVLLGTLPGRPGTPSVVLTADLTNYLVRTRLRDISLPIGRTAVVRLRREAGATVDRWWADRENDLRTMTLQSFADKHGCSVGAASQRRAMLDDRA